MNIHKPIAALLLATLLTQEATADWLVRPDIQRMAVDSITEDAAIVYSCSGALNIIRGDKPAALISLAVDDRPLYVSSPEPRVVQSNGGAVISVLVSPPLEFVIDLLNGSTLRIAWDENTVIEFDITGFYEGLLSMNCGGHPTQTL